MNSIGGSSLDIGSVAVTTLNLAGYALQANSVKEFFDILTENTKLAIETNDVVRDIIKRNIEKGLLPNYTHELMKLSRQFNSIGLNGCWEAAKKFGMTTRDEFGYCDYTEEGIEFVGTILDKINAIKDSYNFDYSINLEQTPMENGAIKIARKNALLYGSEDYITGNQWIPLKDKATIQARVRAAGAFDNRCGGGCITHIQIDAPFASKDQAWEVLNYVAKNNVVYFAFNLKINIDKNKHSFTSKICPICGQSPEETYQRIVGYLVPTHSWSEKRAQELTERDWMSMDDLIL